MKFPRPRHSLGEYMARYEREHTKLGTKLTHMVGIPMLVASVPTVLVNPPAAAGLFVGGWALQFVGHYVFEGNRPAFYDDPYYLLVGPLWVAAECLKFAGIAVPEVMRPAGDVTVSHSSNGSTAEAS